MNPAAFFVVLAFAFCAALALLWRRWNRRLANGLAKVDAAWKELEKALAERVEALQAMHAALEQAGYVPEGRPRLREAVTALRGAQGPRAQAVADFDVEAVLHQIYRGLPRDRIEAIRSAQNRLAQADEERDIARTRYNDLALSWLVLARRFPYRTIATRKG
ncbi:TPA: hypothetical protein DCY67_04150, partial [Candidatus Acetothermia bacterium]|nr:hypothetical protein [Candidatus Acetothermia bacterium]